MIPFVKKTAVIYVRVSIDEQVENTSLETQETACGRWCAQNGYEIGGVFADKGESAKTADRPAFLRLVEHCRKHKPTAAVAYRIDRWSRNVTDFAVYRSRLASWGVQMLSATEQITDDPSGRALALLGDLPRLLANAEREQRDAILSALVGSNVSVMRSGELRTGDSSCVYGLFEHVSGSQNGLAPPTGSIPEPDWGKLRLRLQAIGKVA